MLGRVKGVYPSFYGFIADEEGTNYFFHGSQYKGDWDELRKISPPNTSAGPVVQFKPVEHEKGLRASNVELLEAL